MGYRGDCEHLTCRHNCKKYKKRLAYSSYSSSWAGMSGHERCSECEKDYKIAALEEMLAEAKKRLPTEQIVEQAIEKCCLRNKYGDPGREEGMCAGLRTLNGDGEPCWVCKDCKLQYQYAEEAEHEEN